MKKTTMMAAALAAFALVGTGKAGSLAEPIVEAPLIIEDTSSSSSGTSLVLLLAVIMSIPALTD